MAEPERRSGLRLAVAGVFSIFVVGGLSLHMVIAGLPVILSDLDGNQVQYTWMVAITLLANAAATPIWGKFADMTSKKRLFELSGVLLAGSALAGTVAPNIEVLLLARFVQGVALGGIGTLAMTILGSLVPPRERGRFAGYIGVSMMTAAAGGPLLGGLITDTLGWRWCFAVVLPMMLLGLFLVHRTLRLPEPKQSIDVDYTGALLMVCCSSVVLFWLSVAGVEGFFGWLSWPSLVAVVLGAGLLGLFVLVERRSRNPLISLQMFLQRTPLLACISAMSIAVCMFGLPPFLMQYFQMGYGLTPTEAGMMVVPYVLGNVASTTLTGWLIARRGRWKAYLVGGAVLLTVSVAALAGAALWKDELWLIGLLLFAAGLGFGAQLQNLMMIVQNAMTAEQLGQASSLVQFFRTFGGAVGSAVLGAVMAAQVGGLTSFDAGAVAPGSYIEGSVYVFAAAALLTLPAVVTNALLKETPLRGSV